MLIPCGDFQLRLNWSKIKTNRMNYVVLLVVLKNEVLQVAMVKNLFMSFCTIFWYVILGWWKIGKQTSYWSKTGFFLSLKNKQCFHPKLLRHHPKIMFKNIVQKDMNKFKLHIFWEGHKILRNLHRYYQYILVTTICTGQIFCVLLTKPQL